MKIKRFLAALLAFVIVVNILPVSGMAAIVSSSAAYNTVTELPAGRFGAPENSISALNNFAVTGGVVSFDLEMFSTLSSSGNVIDAVIMSASDYVGITHKNSPVKVDNTTFNSSSALQVNSEYYRSGTATVTADFKAKFTSLGAKLTFRAMATDNISGNAVTDQDCYYDDYVLILFNAGVGAGAEGRYVVKKFQVDSQGNLKTDSYMVRYIKNTASMGTTAEVKFENDKNKSIAPQITKPSSEPTTLTTAQYTRTGYTFIGWDTDPQFLQKKGEGTVSATGMGTDWVNSVASMNDATAKTGIDYPVGAVGSVSSQPADSIYNLYAQWKPIQITLTPATDRYNTLETTPHDAEYDDYQAKVNERFSWEFDVAGASGTTKGVMVTDVKEVAPGTTTPISGSITTKDQLLNTYGLSVASAPSNSVANAGGFDLKTGTGGKAYLTGTPKKSTTNDILVTVRTWDKTNFSYAVQVLRIKGIAKGAQAAPARDVSTGLQSNVLKTAGTEESTETKDGVIFGFYSEAQGAAGGYKDISSGTGSIYDNYTKIQGTRTESLLYEYIPYKDAEGKDYYNTDDVATAKFNPGVAENWREVPLPKTFYNAGELGTLTPSMEKGAAVKTHSSNKSNTAQSAKVTTETPESWTGWSAEYGRISFDAVTAFGEISADSGNFPVVHDLVEGATYLVRLKANADNTASRGVEIVIKEGGGGGNSGETPIPAGGLAVNLVGGTVAEAEQETFNAFVSSCHSLTPGQTVTIPELTPVKQYYEFAGWTLGKFNEDGALITFKANDTVTLGDEPSSLAAVWNATTEAFFPIVFYDWDGVTKLGTKIVPIVSDVATQERLIDDAMREFAEMQMSEPNAEAYRGEAYDPSQGTDEAFYNESKPLSNKKGYTFGKWIDFDAKDENGNEVYTSYGAAVQVQNNQKMADDLPEPAGHVFSAADYTNGITVKAAFCTNATLAPQKDYTGTETAKWNYTVSVESPENDYLQFGGTANYGVTVTVKRENEGVGVPRVRQLGLRVALTIQGAAGSVYVLQRLDNQDEITATIALNGAVTKATVEAIDLCDVAGLGGTANWANGASGRSNSLELLPSGETGFVQLSGVGFFNDLCRTSLAMGLTGDDWIKNTDAFKASGLTAAASTNYSAAGLKSSSSANARRQNVGKILNAYIAKGGPLNQGEMQTAINGG